MTAEKLPSTVPTAKKFGRVWHAAADADEAEKARAGKSFRTRCGLTATQARGPRASRKARELQPLEPCVVCGNLRSFRPEDRP